MDREMADELARRRLRMGHPWRQLRRSISQYRSRGGARGLGSRRARPRGLSRRRVSQYSIARRRTLIGGLMAAANTSVAREYHAGLAALLSIQAALAAQRG